MLRGVRNNQNRDRSRSFVGKMRDKAARLRPLGERRKTGRIRSEDLGCDLGEVVDLSAGGMRIRTNRRLHGRMKVEIWSKGNHLTLDAKVAWSKRVAFRKYDIGLQFLGVNGKLAEALTQFAVFLPNR